MRLFFRHLVIFLGVIFLLILSSGCANDTKRFSEISSGFAKSINLLNKEPGITTTGFGSDQNKKLFKIGIGIDRSIMTEEHLKQLLQSYLTNVASYTSEPDPQKLLEPYNLQIEEISKAEIGPAFSVKLIAEKPSGSTVISWKSISFNDFEEKAKEKGLTESMLKTLNNLGFSEEEILELTPEKIAEIFAPGTQLDGAGFDPDANQTKELQKVGIDINMSIILYNLGYTYDDMLVLSANEIDFIFPNTELLANLKLKGFSEQGVQSTIGKGKTYKEIIKEALKEKEKGAVWQAAKDYMEAKGFTIGENIGDIVLVVGQIFDHRAVVIYGPYASEFNDELLLEEEAGNWRVKTNQSLYNTNNELAVEAMKALASIEGLDFGHEPGQMKVGVKEQGQDFFTLIIGKYGWPWSAEYDMEKAEGVWSIFDKREIQ